MKRKIPGYYNYTVMLTYCGMLFAFCGILRAIGGDYLGAVFCLLLAGVCDMFDGAVAATRPRTDSEKNFGVQIDSLSDLISFGVFPGIFVYMISDNKLFAGLTASLFALCALIRLAYFNVLEDERKQLHIEGPRTFLGIPVTMVAMSLPAVWLLYDYRIVKNILCFPVLLIFQGAGYLAPVEIRKPGRAGKAWLLFIGCLELLALLALFMGSGRG